jgi:hypothetical protein
LSRNATFVLRPLDQGMIKTLYRKLLLEYLLDLSENEKEYAPITLKQAINIGVAKSRHIIRTNIIILLNLKLDIVKLSKVKRLPNRIKYEFVTANRIRLFWCFFFKKS